MHAFIRVYVCIYLRTCGKIYMLRTRLTLYFEAHIYFVFSSKGHQANKYTPSFTFTYYLLVNGISIYKFEQLIFRFVKSIRFVVIRDLISDLIRNQRLFANSDYSPTAIIRNSSSASGQFKSLQILYLCSCMGVSEKADQRGRERGKKSAFWGGGEQCSFMCMCTLMCA